MKLLRPRLSIRLVMILVVVVAVGLGGAKLYGLHLRYARLADGYAAQFLMHEGSAGSARVAIAKHVEAERNLPPPRPSKEHPGLMEGEIYQGHLRDQADLRGKFLDMLREGLSRNERDAAYYRSMRDRYRHAANRPWLTLPPDPPPPK